MLILPVVVFLLLVILYCWIYALQYGHVEIRGEENKDTFLYGTRSEILSFNCQEITRYIKHVMHEGKSILYDRFSSSFKYILAYIQIKLTS